MKVFFITFFVVAVLLHIYICIRTYQGLEYIPSLRLPAVVLVILLIVIFILNQAGILSFGFCFNRWVSLFSSAWIFVLFGIFISLLLIDFVRVLNHFIDFLPTLLKNNYILFKFILMVITITAIVFWYILGHLNFTTPQKTELDISINKPQVINATKTENNLKIVLVSDLHIGYIINKKKLKQYVDSINSQDADIVFIVGDLCDREIEPIIDQKMYEELSSIKSRLGVYVVTGNHEYIGEKDMLVEYYKKSGLNVLEDSAVLIDNSFYVVGRNDRSDKNRKKTAELVKNIDKTKPIILLDHQPFNLQESVSAGIDLHLSGHTHDGQFFPINLITKAVYEVSAGYKKKDNTHIYVSSGLGIWGPPVRIATKSEFVVINFNW